MKPNESPFVAPISRLVWEIKYRADEDGRVEEDVRATWRRVARALAEAEPKDRERWAECFYRVLEGFTFLPGG